LTPRVVAHCRAGFEPEAVADLQRVAAVAGTTIELDAPARRGYVVATPQPFEARRWTRALVQAPPVFVRALFVGSGPHLLFEGGRAASRPDRVTPLAALIKAFGAEDPLGESAAISELRLETADTNEGKELSGLCRAIERPLADRIDVDAEASATPNGCALHVLLVDGAHVYIGASRKPWGSPWPMGIPRLRMPGSAPSRSVLKLAEAFVTFLGERERGFVQAGMRAIDLGAAPGGWTWLLAQRGLRVTAVDNGPLKGEIAHDPLVTHLRVDGLTYVPRRPVDWLVCDIVEQPSRIASLVARWVGEGYTARAIFNLKLPMRKRYDEVRRCASIVADGLVQRGVKHSLALRQLYHDREEVTGFVERL
jgi:23S rRNA (cytidine2498-2'-O)-methyltransferase